MKILLISNLYPSKEYPFFGTFVQNFEAQLSKKGFTFTKAVIRGKAKTKSEKIKKYLKFFKDVISAVKKDDYDIIYVHYIGHSLLPLLFVRHLIKKPLVLNAHGSDVLVISKLSLLIQKIVTPIIKQADLLVVPSVYFQNVVHEKFMIGKSNIFISPSGGIDTKLFSPQNTQKQKKKFTVGFVSRIDKGKGWDVLLQSMSMLKDKNIRFLLVGSGSQDIQMRKMIERLELQNIVEVHEAQPHEKLPHYFNQMDIFAFTTRLAESLGLVGIEAMTCGVPVVGSNAGGVPSYIKDGVNGKLFEVGDSIELAKCIEEFVEMDKAEFDKYKIQALETGKRYDSKVVANELSGKLNNFLKEKNER
jgi:glycosyltransferase involved in cell wall biosynthesis